jgi:hypothetical protein
VARAQLTSDPEEDEIIPDSELEFEDLENAVQNESSGDSSDNFIPEESSQSDVSQDDEPNIPIRAPKATPNTSTRPSSSKAGPSSKTSRGRRSAAKAQSEADSSDLSGTDDSFTVHMKAHRRKKAAPTRGKGRRNVVYPRRRGGRRSESIESDGESDNSDGLLEPSDDDAKPPPKGLQPHEILKLIKVAQRRMRKRLGRKLTLVRLRIVYSSSLLY